MIDDCEVCGNSSDDAAHRIASGAFSHAYAPADIPGTRTAVVTFLRGKLDAAEQSVRAREGMAATHDVKLTPAEWRAAMALSPRTRDAPMPTDEQRRASAARERRIADMHRLEVRMYQAAIALLGVP